MQNIQKERKSALVKVKKYKSQWQEKLDENQSAQLFKVTSIINEQHKDILEEVLSSDKSNFLRKEWENDKQQHIESWKIKQRMVNLIVIHNYIMVT